MLHIYMNSKKKSDYLNDIIKDDVFIDKLVTRKLYNNSLIVAGLVYAGKN